MGLILQDRLNEPWVAEPEKWNCLSPLKPRRLSEEHLLAYLSHESENVCLEESQHILSINEGLCLHQSQFCLLSLVAATPYSESSRGRISSQAWLEMVAGARRVHQDSR